MQIKHLTDLRPAEALYLVHGNLLPVGKLIFATMMDLVFREVLVMDKDIRQHHASDRAREVFTIGTGPGFASFSPSRYEAAIYNLWKADPENRFLLNTMVSGVWNKYPKDEYWQNAVKKEMTHYRSNSLLNIFRRYPLNKHGEKVRKELLAELSLVNNEFSLRFTDDKQVELIRAMGANVFLTRLSPKLPSFQRAYTMKDYWKDVRDENVGSFFMDIMIGAGDSVGESAFGGFLDNISFDIPIDFGG